MCTYHHVAPQVYRNHGQPPCGTRHGSRGVAVEVSSHRSEHTQIQRGCKNPVFRVALFLHRLLVALVSDPSESLLLLHSLLQSYHHTSTVCSGRCTLLIHNPNHRISSVMISRICSNSGGVPIRRSQWLNCGSIACEHISSKGAQLGLRLKKCCPFMSACQP